MSILEQLDSWQKAVTAVVLAIGSGATVYLTTLAPKWLANRRARNEEEERQHKTLRENLQADAATTGSELRKLLDTQRTTFETVIAGLIARVRTLEQDLEAERAKRIAEVADLRAAYQAQHVSMLQRLEEAMKEIESLRQRLKAQTA